VPRALHSTGRGVELALGERAVVVRTAILDRIQRPGAVEDADLDAVRAIDQTHLAGRQLGGGANVDLFLCAFGHVIPSPEVGF